jgi:uncharacterized repeat protein (TIGR03803 family)
MASAITKSTRSGCHGVLRSYKKYSSVCDSSTETAECSSGKSGDFVFDAASFKPFSATYLRRAHREGNLYGTAVTGGSGSCEGGCGVVYKLTKSGGTWTQAVIHAFTGGDDGSGSGATVTVDQGVISMEWLQPVVRTA